MHVRDKPICEVIRVRAHRIQDALQTRVDSWGLVHRRPALERPGRPQTAVLHWVVFHCGSFCLLGTAAAHCGCAIQTDIYALSQSAVMSHVSVTDEHVGCCDANLSP